MESVKEVLGDMAGAILLIRDQSGILIACLPGAAPPVLLVLIACDRALHPDGIFRSLESPKALFTNAPSKAVMYLKERRKGCEDV
jgi:hypothetical protein